MIPNPFFFILIETLFIILTGLSNLNDFSYRSVGKGQVQNTGEGILAEI